MSDDAHLAKSRLSRRLTTFSRHRKEPATSRPAEPPPFLNAITQGEFNLRASGEPNTPSNSMSMNRAKLIYEVQNPQNELRRTSGTGRRDSRTPLSMARAHLLFQITSKRKDKPSGKQRTRSFPNAMPSALRRSSTSRDVRGSLSRNSYAGNWSSRESMSRESSADDHDSWRHSLSEGSSSSQLLDDKDQQLEKKNEQLAAAKNEERSLRRENSTSTPWEDH